MPKRYALGTKSQVYYAAQQDELVLEKLFASIIGQVRESDLPSSELSQKISCYNVIHV